MNTPRPDPDGDRWSVPISALEHHAYCPRQAVLIWQEAYFDANADTVRGDLAHEAVDRGGALTGCAGARIWRSLRVRSDRWAIHGICNTVHCTPDGALVPIEHKSGTYRPGGPADLQLAAQVVCLREMFDQPVPHGEIFAGKHRRRFPVTIGDARTEKLHAAVDQIRRQVADPVLPPPVNDRRCKKCSLRPGCMPETLRPPGELFRPRPLRDHD